jgi:IMP dehydrogenase/GMP reductase
MRFRLIEPEPPGSRKQRQSPTVKCALASQLIIDPVQTAIELIYSYGSERFFASTRFGKPMNSWPDSRILELLGIQVPIIQAPMAGAVLSEMVIAVSEAGGLGSLPCAMLKPGSNASRAHGHPAANIAAHQRQLFLPPHAAAQSTARVGVETAPGGLLLRARTRSRKRRYRLPVAHRSTARRVIYSLNSSRRS